MRAFQLTQVEENYCMLTVHTMSRFLAGLCLMLRLSDNSNLLPPLAKRDEMKMLNIFLIIKVFCVLQYISLK